MILMAQCFAVSETFSWYPQYIVPGLTPTLSRNFCTATFVSASATRGRGRQPRPGRSQWGPNARGCWPARPAGSRATLRSCSPRTANVETGFCPPADALCCTAPAIPSTSKNSSWTFFFCLTVILAPAIVLELLPRRAGGLTRLRPPIGQVCRAVSLEHLP